MNQQPQTKTNKNQLPQNADPNSHKQTVTSSSSVPFTAQPSQEDLVQLQPDTDSIVKRLVGPKVIILTFLSLMFISKNIYNIFVIGIPDSNPTLVTNTTLNSTSATKSDEKVPEDDSIMERMYGYCILTAVLFVLYIFLVRSNDRALLRKIQEQKKKIAQQEEQKLKNQQNDTNVTREKVQEKNGSVSDNKNIRKQD